MTGEQLCISTSFRSDTTRLSQIQLILSIVLGIGAILLAYRLGFRQINIANKQSEITDKQLDISRWQFEVDCIRYKLDVANSRALELKTNGVNIDNKLSQHNLTQESIIELNILLNQNRIEHEENQKLIEHLIKEYNNSLSRNPNDFSVKL